VKLKDSSNQNPAIPPKKEKLFPPTTLEEGIGCVGYTGPPLTLEEIDRLLEEDIRRTWSRTQG